jgi:uncharacterized repeat protein (TIGR01451 family)
VAVLTQGSNQAFGAPPPPGTQISNQVRLNYVDPVLFVGRDLYSNTVTTAIAGSPRFELTADRTQTISPGSYFSFPHRLINTGNVTETFSLNPEVLPGGDFNLQQLNLVLDINSNQAVDVGEPNLPFSAYTVTLAPGESLDVILVGLVDPATPNVAGLSTQLQLTATQLSDGAQIVNTDTINIGAGELQFFKSVNTPTALRGDEIIYSLRGTNNFPDALGPIGIFIDGAPASKLLVRDALPANIQFVEVVAANNAIPLYHIAGDPLHTYQSTPPADLSTVDAIVFAFNGLPAINSFDVSFRARVGPAASGTIPNTARVYASRGLQTLVTTSNPALVTIPSTIPTIEYHRDDNFAQVIPATRLGSPLFLEVNAGDCNLNPAVVETLIITITSQLTGDSETYNAIESGPNTGVFHVYPVPTQDAASHAVVAGDGVLQTLPRDVLTASILSCGGIQVETIILIDPAGIVYDSRTNLPLAGATVTLIDVTGAGNGGNAGGPAVILDEDGVTPVNATQVTGADGEFRYPLVSASQYRLDVIPPADYNFPSVIPPGQQPAGRRINLFGSYGGSFPVNLITGAVFLDVPLDTTLGDGMTLEKTVSRETADIGDSVIYTLTLSNNSGADFLNTFIDDYLPQGFRYESGTTRRDGVAVADPDGAPGRNLRFFVGTLADGASTTFTYRVRLTFGAERGNGINSAQATSFGPPILPSNIATARVRVGEGIFDSRAVIIGTVFVDLNGNGIQDPGEPGVPGVRLILEDGTYAITDHDGQYSIYGLRPITRVLKLDPHTLPAGAQLSTMQASRFAGDPNSRFVDLRRHELHKANFALIEPTEAVLEAIEKRRAQAESWRTEIDSALDRRLTADGRLVAPGDVRSREASGIKSGGGGATIPAPFASVLPEGTLTSGNSSLPPRAAALLPSVDLERVVDSMTDSSLGFIDLRDGDILPRDRATIRIKGHAESNLQLIVNGSPASEARIGKEVVSQEPPIKAIEYVGISLRPGFNELEVVQSDFFGNERGREKITVTAPGSAARLQINLENEAPAADGNTPLVVHITVRDANGMPVTASMPITLETTLGKWDVVDENPREPGVQVFLRDGEGTFALLPPHEPGEARLRVSSGRLSDERRVAFLPELRPMVVSGIVEGRLNLRRLSSSDIMPLDPFDAFEETFRESMGDGSGRAAFYLKGKISGETLLTIAYDSDKRRDDVELFRDLDPDAFYPVYGDSSVRGYDAQSTGKLYVRIDRHRSYLLLGDFNTRSEDEVRQLGDYNRSFNGVRLNHETARYKFNTWASDDSTSQVVREIPANGTSGPFNFNAGSGLLGSDIVEVLVRDRNQPSVILSIRRLSRFVDYEFEPFSGRLLLRRPLPSVDENFNPQSIRITYETENNQGDTFWVYGGNTQIRLTDRFEVGGSFARDENPRESYEINSVNATLEVAKDTYLMAEGARTDTFAQGEGFGGRVELRHRSERTEGRIHYGTTEETFDNPNSTLNSGRIEGGAKVTHSVAPRTQIIGEAIHTEDQINNGKRQGVRADVAHTLDNQVKITVGARVSEETAGTGGAPAGPGVVDPVDPVNRLTPASDISVRSLRLRADTPVPGSPRATLFAEYEQDVVISRQRVVAGGGTWQVNDKTRVYARHEFISSLGGNFELNESQRNNRTLVGTETEYMRDGHLFSEYRMQNAIDGPQAEASTGLRNGWQVAEGLRLNTSFERVTPFEGTVSRKSTAATGAVEYTAPDDWKASGRLEGRWADTTDSYLNTLGYARRINEEWTWLARSIVNVQLTDATADDLVQGRLLTGLAFRQHGEDRWNTLFRYEYKYEQGSTFLAPAEFGMRRHVHQGAITTNYQPERDWILSGTWATKYVYESYNFDPDGSYFAHLLAGRVLHDITEKWDVGLNLGVTFSNSKHNFRYAVGPEIGYRLQKNVRVGLGYNIVGFSDRDFDTSSTAQGLFLSLRLKFDENLFRWANFNREEGQP